MTKPILIIDAGHGGKDPGGGSSAFWDPNGFYEKSIVLLMSLYQYERFKQLGVPVALTRDEDTHIDSTPRANLVKNSGAKYCISNHINAAGVATARGVETIHSIYSDGKLAKALFDAIVAEGVPGRRVFKREGANGKDYYFMHRQTGAVETVIVEYGFATNEQDAKLIQANWKVYAEAVVRAFCEFVSHPYSEVKPAPTNDYEAHWASEDIEKILEAGYMNGYPDGTFKPDQPMTRAEMAVTLARVLKL